MKNILLFTMCVLAAGTLLAQETVRFGVKAGGTYSLMNFNAGANIGSATFANKWKPGFYLGAVLEVPLDETFSLQPEYLYRRLGGRQEQSGTDYMLQYLSLPVLLKASLTPRLAIVAGPEFGLLIHASATVRGTTYDQTHDTEERAVSAVGGIEFRLLQGLVLDLRYVHGLNHVGLGQRSAVQEFKWRQGELGLVWKK